LNLHRHNSPSSPLSCLYLSQGKPRYVFPCCERLTAGFLSDSFPRAAPSYHHIISSFSLHVPPPDQPSVLLPPKDSPQLLPPDLPLIFSPRGPRGTGLALSPARPATIYQYLQQTPTSCVEFRHALPPSSALKYTVIYYIRPSIYPSCLVHALGGPSQYSLSALPLPWTLVRGNRGPPLINSISRYTPLPSLASFF
jgi:hypothetical protein